MITEKHVWAVNTLPSKHLEVVRWDQVLRDDVVISSKPWRVALSPGDDVSGLPADIQASAAAAWTPELMAAKTAEVVSQAQAETATREAAKAAAEQAKLDAEQAEADAKAAQAASEAAQAAAKLAADAAEAENARVKAAQAEADRMAAEAKAKAEFDAAVAAKVAELAV